MKIKRLVVEVSEKDHTTIKRLAVDHNTSIKKLITDAIALYITAIKGRMTREKTE